MCLCVQNSWKLPDMNIGLVTIPSADSDTQRIIVIERFNGDHDSNLIKSFPDKSIYPRITVYTRVIPDIFKIRHVTYSFFTMHSFLTFEKTNQPQ